MAELLVPTQDEIDRAQQDAPYALCDIPDPYNPGARRPLTVVCRANTDVGHREKNVASNIVRPLPRFVDRADFMQLRDEPIAIVAGGPSARKHLDKIRQFKWVMAAGSSHDWLIDNGIVPTFAVSTDSKEETNDYFKRLDPGVQYVLASVLPPSLFDRLEAADCPTWLWHFNEQVDPAHYRGERPVGWGCMVGVVCIQIALWLGFQRQHYFGYDCCLDRESFATHAYTVSARERAEIWENVTEAMVGEEQTKFLTTTALICCATHFFGVYRCPDNQYLKGHVYGPGLLHDQVRQSPPEMQEWLEAV